MPNPFDILERDRITLRILTPAITVAELLSLFTKQLESLKPLSIMKMLSQRARLPQ